MLSCRWDSALRPLGSLFKSCNGSLVNGSLHTHLAFSKIILLGAWFTEVEGTARALGSCRCSEVWPVLQPGFQMLF